MTRRRATSDTGSAAAVRNGEGLELRAAAAIAYALNARAIRRDFGGRRIRDFDLRLDDGSIEPLEITAAADEVVRRTWARIEQLDQDAPSLANVWTLDVPNTVAGRDGTRALFTARDFLAEAEPLLWELEAAGIREFNPTSLLDAGAAEHALDRLLKQGCDLGLSHPVAPGETGRIHLATGIGGWVDPDLVADAIEQEAAKDDNLTKLTEPATAQRRHLGVVIDASTGATLSAGVHGNLGRIPALPPPITTAWALAGTFAHTSTPPAGWETHLIPEGVFAHPENWLERSDRPHRR